MKTVPLYKRNIEFYIREAYRNVSDIGLIAQYIVNDYKKKYIAPSDEKLLNLFFKEDVSQEDLDNFLDEWDIEKEGGHKALILSYFMKKHPEFTYSQYIGPRLSGILKYYRFRNLSILSHYKKVCTALKQANIDILIMKGGALKYYYPELPRIMGDIDILVHEQDYEKAKSIALSFNYKNTEYSHSIDLYDPTTDITVLDIHHKLDMQTDTETLINEDFFNRSKIEKVFNVEGICVPSPEDMLFLLLINLNKNMARWTSMISILYSIIDSMYLINIKPDFDWDIIRQNAKKTKTELQVSIATKFLNEFVPNKLPDIFAEDFYTGSILYLYNDWFIKTMRKRSHTLFFDVLKRMYNNLKYYFRFRYYYPQYKQKSIRTNVELAKSILEKQDLIKR